MLLISFSICSVVYLYREDGASLAAAQSLFCSSNQAKIRFCAGFCLHWMDDSKQNATGMLGLLSECSSVVSRAIFCVETATTDYRHDTVWSCLISWSDWFHLISLSDAPICSQPDLFVHWSMIKWDCTSDLIRFSNCTTVWTQHLTWGLVIIKGKEYLQWSSFFLIISHQLHLDTEILYQAFEWCNDYVLIRTQTGCGRAGTGEGEVLWTQRDCGALWKGHARQLCAHCEG